MLELVWLHISHSEHVKCSSSLRRFFLQGFLVWTFQKVLWVNFGPLWMWKNQTGDFTGKGSWPYSSNLSENDDSTCYAECFHLFLAFEEKSHFPFTKSRKMNKKSCSVFFLISYLYIGFKICRPPIQNNIQINLDLHFIICSFGKKKNS